MDDVLNPHREILGQFIDAVAQDQGKARELLSHHPWLKTATWRLGESLVHFLAVENYSAGVKWLLENGFEVDSANEFGDTALFDVIKISKYEMANLLLENGANPMVRSPTYGSLADLADLLEDDVMMAFVDSITPTE